MKKLSNFGTVLEEIRVESGMSNGDFAKRIGVSPVYLSSLKKYNKPIPESFYKKLITNVDLNPDQEKKLKKAFERTRLFKALDSFELTDEQERIIYNLASYMKNFSTQQMQISKSLANHDFYEGAIH